MVAVSRFVEFSVTADTAIGATADNGAAAGSAVGVRSYTKADGTNAEDANYDITLNSNDQLVVTINGVGSETITLVSGTDLDPRFIAQDITRKLHSANTDPAFEFAQCEYRNFSGPASASSNNDKNSLIIYSGVLGNAGGSNDVTLGTAGGRDAKATLGFDSLDSGSGAATSNGFAGTATVTGSYGGQFDDIYTLQISDKETVTSITPNGGNTYNGTAEAGGIHTGTANDTYTVTVGVAAGNSTMGAGPGNVPTFTVTSTQGDSNANPIDLLFPNHWYDVGTRGTRVRFTDAVFGNGDTFSILVSGTSGLGGGGGTNTATYIFTSPQEDSSKQHSISPVTTTTAAGGSQVGTRGVAISFSSGTFTAGDTFHIMCRGPQPLSENITQLNFGNVTVSTKSPVKVVWFELVSGAVSMSTVKFSLQSDGTFSHHDQGDADTEFHYGTAGAGNDAAGSGSTANDQIEWPVNASGIGRIVATDIDSDTPPNYLFATKQDLAVVSSADDAESVGNFLGALVSDFIFLAINLGANETGANSTINYRMFFDFSS